MRFDRAERKKDLVCSQTTYDRVFWHLRQLPAGVEHVVIQLGMLWCLSSRSFAMNLLLFMPRYPDRLSQDELP